MRALIVDDEYALAEAIGDLLVDEGFEIELAHDGRQALERVAARRPDVVLLDLMMPFLDGKQTLRRLRAEPAWRDIPVVLMSSGGMLVGEVLTGEFMPVTFLRKPFDFTELMEAIGEVTGRGPKPGAGA